ncbi:unnamed protein product [Rhizophagus irregularis]|uniref:MATA-HMG n=4 Tax=Rhizophagus irregularis TaxID=588596 RepID=A0A1B1EVN7_9GLOM|nr:hypothetical protein GLOIN_2v1679719 [Rhizophagus irregularis DAOM 181602=DAOM 197198]ANQ32872.1 MATA-HMG [Rhizophagus irregularis]EXX75821.1 Rox1p [Rhizophagus irregularis DAOM 197198w]ANQ32873.1 MATA-HMG [Rhizophagus irregularis]ANQ32875.1 MATA-HMG [Rhizophagus irregularis]ANQ32876.1 MATA-HMG [Rhizophagus irregularis]|eukprot:XP_025170865.1 hypothetical protein GLOIN_2v1679719 [Rhizophagus irregularis DAOM 181602=DAOM 197198]
MASRIRLQQKTIFPPYNQNNKVRAPDQLLVEQVINSIEPNIIETISNQVFLPIKELIAPLPKKSRTSKVPRPQNPFVIYRRDTQAKLMVEKGSKFGSKLDFVSRVASKNWKNAPSEIRNIYSFLAQLAKKVHEETYPDYVYQPKKRSERFNSISTAFPISSDISDNDSHNSNLSDISFPSLPVLTPPADNYNNNPWPYPYTSIVSSSSSFVPFNDTSENFTLYEMSGLRVPLPQLEHCRPIYMTDPYDRKMIDRLPLTL